MIPKSVSRSIRYAGAALAPLTSMLPAMAFGSLLCIALALSMNLGPFQLIEAVLRGSWGSGDAIAVTLSKATPLLLTGVAVALAFQGRLLNIGCEGQLTLGALTSATLATTLGHFPTPVAILLAISGGAAAGALWAWPAIWLKQRRGVHEVITTLLMNIVALNLADYLVRGPLGDGSGMGRTPQIPASASWPAVWQPGSYSVSAAPFVAVLLTFVVQIWLARTSWGFEARAVGANPVAARAQGIHVTAWQRRLFLASGGLAGIAGALEILAVHQRFYIAFSPGYGFDGITAAFLVNATPGWLWLSGLMMASLRSADKWLQLAVGISPSAILIIQASLLVAVACHPRLVEIARSLRDRLPMKAGFPAEEPGPDKSGNGSSPDSTDSRPHAQDIRS